MPTSGLNFGMLPLDVAQPITQFRDLPAEALYVSGATMHDTFLQFRDLPAEALYRSGATMHNTFGHQIESPYVVPEAGTGVITNYSA